MRAMDQGQLQKILTAGGAAAAVPTTPQQNNPMMLFQAMTSQASTPSTWPAKHVPLTATQSSSSSSSLSPQDSFGANLAAYILLQQALQNQHALLPSSGVSSVIPSAFHTLSNFATSTNVPECAATPPGVVFSTLSTLLQMPNAMDSSKCSTPPVIIQPSTTPLDTLRKLSSVSTPADFVHASAGSLSASSPSTSSKKEEEDDEDDEEEFVDIESVDVTIDGKEKRKAHVEFYRRMKYMRQHYRDKALQCGICKQKVDNHENAMSVHVAQHADAGCYQCRLCGWQAIDKYKIYTHMRVEHPRKVDMFVDKRDMPKMCLVLSQCFPKTTCRPKKESNRNADTYLTELLRSSSTDKTCNICKGVVRRDKAAMIRHVQTNHTIKCKTCKTISTTLEDQLAHQDQSHQLKEPKMTVHYAPSAAAIYLLPALEKCFSSCKK